MSIATKGSRFVSVVEESAMLSIIIIFRIFYCHILIFFILLGFFRLL